MKEAEKPRKGFKTGLGASMTGGNPADGRQEGDFYPTPPDVTKALCLRYAEVLENRTILEPCAGDGTMVDILAPFCRTVVAADIAPRRSDVKQADLFEMSVRKSWCVVTNPPFDIAENVIRHVLNFKPVFVALVLKATYWHARQRVELFRTYRPYAIHPLTWRPDFLGKGAPTMDVMWCVWQHDSRGEPLRDFTIYAPMLRPE